MIKSFLTLELGEGAWLLLWIATWEAQAQFPSLFSMVWVSLSKLIHISFITMKRAASSSLSLLATQKQVTD